MDLEKLIDQLAKIESSMSGLLEEGVAPRQSKPHLPPFQPRTDLQSVSSLSRVAAEDPQTGSLVLMQLSDFFLAGALLQRRAWRGDSAWSITEYICQGQHRKLSPQMQADLSHLVKGISPATVKRAPAAALLSLIPLALPIPAQDTQAYLMAPTNEVAYIWFSQTPTLWSEDQMRHTLRLINQAFTP